MIYREAGEIDIEQMHELRLAVKENVLVTHALVTRAHYLKYLFEDGKGWVADENGILAGFAIVDLKGKNVWGLFVSPGFERQGIGKKLQTLMLNWYFSLTKETISLNTAQHTRAEKFYIATGWKRCGIFSNGEVKFEMECIKWQSISKK